MPIWVYEVEYIARGASRKNPLSTGDVLSSFQFSDLFLETKNCLYEDAKDLDCQSHETIYSQGFGQGNQFYTVRRNNLTENSCQFYL